MKIKVTELKFARRFRTGEYEHEDYSVAVSVEEGDISKVFSKLKMDVNSAFTGEESPSLSSEPEMSDEKEETSIPAVTGRKKKAKKKTKMAPKEEEETPEEEMDDEEPSTAEEEEEGAPEEEGSDEEASDEDEDEDEETSDEEEEEVAPARAAKKKKKVFKKKPQVYTRSSEQHKEIFSRIVKSVSPDWKKTDEGKKKAKMASQKMEGIEFLDDAGEVLPEFKAQVKKLMTGRK